MKTIYLILLITITSFVFAQKAEQIKSFADVKKSQEYYTEQAKLWKAEIDKNQKNANAWQNYYKAVRYNYKVYEVGSQQILDSILYDMQKVLPNSFEYNYLMYYNSTDWGENVKYIEKAYEINPNYIELYPSLITSYEVTGQVEKRNAILKKWYKANNLEAWKYYFNYNALAFLDSNAIIFSSGDNTIYPKLLLQQGKNIRKDVKIITIPFIIYNNSDYYKNLLKELKIKDFNEKDVKIDKNSDTPKYIQIAIARIKHIINNTNRSVYFDHSYYPEITPAFSDNQYLEGIVYKYSKEPYNNTAIIKRNFENNYLLDYLKTDIEPIKSNRPEAYGYGYIMPLDILYNYYKDVNNTVKQEETKQLIYKIGEKCGLLDKIKKQYETQK